MSLSASDPRTLIIAAFSRATRPRCPRYNVREGEGLRLQGGPLGPPSGQTSLLQLAAAAAITSGQNLEGSVMAGEKNLEEDLVTSPPFSGL